MFVTLLTVVLLQPSSPPATTEAMKAFADAKAAYEKQDNDKALAAFDRAIALDGSSADFHHGRCQTLARLQRHAEGIESCSKALQLRPDDAATLIDRGHYHINLRQLDPALADLTRAETMKKDDYGLFYHLALARYINGEFAKAADVYEQCVRTAQSPDNRMSCQAWQYLALVRAGRRADAQRLLDGFSPDPQQTPNAYVERLLLFKGTRTEEQVATLMQKDALQLPTVAYSIGIWHLLNGRDRQAREYFQKALTPPAQPTAFGAVASHFELQRTR
jgi:tetratricopeptide (TPR) repeat protein